MAPAKKKLDLTFTIAGSNILTAGDGTKKTDDILELVYSGPETDVDKVTVTLVEIDEDESIDPKKTGPDATIATFVGKIASGAFTTDSAKIATDKLPASAPFIQVSIGGKNYPTVKLPGVDNENGLFELGVVVTAGASKYRSTWRAYARHYTIRPADGPVMAFITGAEDSSYFAAAGKYWKQHADAVFSKDGMSLQEIVAFLAKHQEGYGEYGEINIVTHGNRLSALLRIMTGGERELKLKTLYRTFGIEGEQSSDPDEQAAQTANAEKFNHTAAELGLGEKSRVVFRACNIGNRPDVLKAVRQYIFADACPVYAPKFLQGYGDGDLITKELVAPFEFFSEDLQHHVPGNAKPPRAPKDPADGTSQEELIAPAFTAAHPSLVFADEKASYTAKISPSKPGDSTYSLSGSEGYFYDFVAHAHWTDAQIIAEMKKGFDAERSEDMEYTKWDQWVPGPITRKDKTKKVGKKVEVETTENIWVTVSGKGAVPGESFVSSGGPLDLGSDPALGTTTATDERPSGITLPHKTVAASHATISTSGAPNVEVQAQPDQTFTLGGRAVESATGTVPMSISVGPFTLAMRREHVREASTELARTLIHWRRPLRADDASVPYGKDRALVVPDVNNSAHYGSSEDPIPSDDDLATLFE
jgi:hypothetical protein